MTASDIPALLPLLSLILTTVLAMLVIGFYRNHQVVFGITIIGLLAATGSLLVLVNTLPHQITPLLQIDGYGMAFMLLTLLAGIVITCFSHTYFDRRSDQPEELYLLLLTAVLGAMVLSMARHFASFFLGLELVSVSLFALISYNFRDFNCLEGGIKYLMLSGIASGLLVFGMALVYADTGTLQFAELAISPASSLQLAGFLLITAALAFKLSLVPFHMWTADVYQGAPAPITALLATVAKGAVFILLLRLILSGSLTRFPALNHVLTLLAIASMITGNLLAIRQDNLKRLMAYSSIAHMGYLLIVVIASAGISRELAAESMIFYLIAYILATLAVFGIITIRSPAHREADDIDDVEGLFKSQPWLAIIMATALLSLGGIPLTAGFIGKFYLFTSGGRASEWFLLGALIVGSGIGLYYYLRVLSTLFRDPRKRSITVESPTLSQNLLLGFLLTLILILGIYPTGLLNLLIPSLEGIR